MPHTAWHAHRRRQRTAAALVMAPSTGRSLLLTPCRPPRRLLQGGVMFMLLRLGRRRGCHLCLRSAQRGLHPSQPRMRQGERRRSAAARSHLAATSALAMGRTGHELPCADSRAQVADMYGISLARAACAFCSLAERGATRAGSAEPRAGQGSLLLGCARPGPRWHAQRGFGAFRLARGTLQVVPDQRGLEA